MYVADMVSLILAAGLLLGSTVAFFSKRRDEGLRWTDLALIAAVAVVACLILVYWVWSD